MMWLTFRVYGSALIQGDSQISRSSATCTGPGQTTITLMQISGRLSASNLNRHVGVLDGRYLLVVIDFLRFLGARVEVVDRKAKVEEELLVDKWFFLLLLSSNIGFFDIIKSRSLLVEKAECKVPFLQLVGGVGEGRKKKIM